MRAAIDIGSNSVRLAMSDGTVTSEITKLADGIERTGALSPAGVAATLDALSAFAAAAKASSRLLRKPYDARPTGRSSLPKPRRAQG